MSIIKQPFSLPTRVGTELFPRVIQPPPQMIARVEPPSLQAAGEQLLVQNYSQIIGWVMSQRNAYNAGIAPVMTTIYRLGNIEIIYRNIQGVEQVSVIAYPAAPKGRKMAIPLGDIWKIGYDNDGIYKDDPQRNYSSRVVIDPTIDEGVGSAIYTIKNIPKLVYWEVEIVELGPELNQFPYGPGGSMITIDWSSTTPPLPGWDKGIPAIGVQPDKGQDFYIDDLGNLTGVWIDPVDKPKESDIKVHYSFPTFLYPAQLGNPPRDIEGASLAGIPIGEIIPRAVGMYRYWVDQPTGVATISTHQTGGGWVFEVVYTTGTVPDWAIVGAKVPIYKIPVSVTPVPPISDPLVPLVSFPEHFKTVAGGLSPDWFTPAMGPSTDLTIEYGMWMSAAPYIVKTGGTTAVESTTDKVWTSWGQYDALHVLDATMPPWNADQGTFDGWFASHHGGINPPWPNGYAPARIVYALLDRTTQANYVSTFQWLSQGCRQLGEVYGKWTFTPPTTETITTYPGSPVPFFLSYSYGWNSPVIKGGENGLNASGTATQYTSSMWTGLDLKKAFDGRKNPKNAAEPGDVIMIAMDQKNQQIWFGLNGAWLGNKPEPNGNGDAVLDSKTTYYPAVSYVRGATKVHMLFGSAQRHSPPAGFEALKGTGPTEFQIDQP